MQPGAAPAPVPIAPSAPVLPAVEVAAPAALDFKLDRPWRVERFAELAAEFHMEPGATGWEAAAREFCVFAREHARQWLVTRRLFGIAPVIPPPGMHPDDLRCWPRAELAGDGYEVQAELDALRALWGTHTRRAESVRQPEAKSTAITTPKGELELDDTILEKFRFHERIFRINVWDAVAKVDSPRPDSENKAERIWFIGRLKEWSKMLVDPIAAPIARDALMNELYLQRLESSIAVASTRDQDRLFEQKDKLSAAYQASVEKLQKMFPEMAVAGKVSFRGVVSDLIVAHRDYYANGDRRLVDKVFTATEIEFGLRSSLQVSARHRFSLSVAIAECIHHLYDPEFRTAFKPSVLKKIDAGFRAAVEAAREAQHEPVVDLEKGVMPGEGDQFEDYNDARCPECDAGISSAANKCPHCGMANPNDQVKETYQ